MSTKVILMNTKAKVWEKTVIIPTYEAAKPNKNPLFLEKRVYQGSSGKVYPHPVIDKISDEKIDKEYKAVFLENDYLNAIKYALACSKRLWIAVNEGRSTSTSAFAIIS